MKLATIVLLGILLLGSFASMQAADKNAAPTGAGQVAADGAGEVVVAYTNGGASTGDICIWYPVLVGDLDLGSLFESVKGAPAVQKEDAYLIWVSDYTGVPLPSNLAFTLFLIPTGTATIYFTQYPGNRSWGGDLEKNDRSTWGEPVAKFVRKAGIFQSLDGGNSGTLISTAELVSSKPFKLNGKTFDFKDLIPHGMTCSETAIGLPPIGANTEETGTCIAVGGGQ
jgi:hypothetical protein